MYVAVVPNRGSPPAILLRESYREAGKTKNRTLANLSSWPAERIEQFRAVLRSGNGGDDFICGHCGSVMLEDFDPSTIKGNPVYQCGVCENNNDLPFAPSGRHWSPR